VLGFFGACPLLLPVILIRKHMQLPRLMIGEFADRLCPRRIDQRMLSNLQI